MKEQTEEQKLLEEAKTKLVRHMERMMGLAVDPTRDQHGNPPGRANRSPVETACYILAKTHHEFATDLLQLNL
jgi:hypothetical protein